MKTLRRTPLVRIPLVAAVVAGALTGTLAGGAQAASLVVSPGLEVTDLISDNGDGTYDANACTIGFSVTDDDGLVKALTAGHCGAAGSEAAVSSILIGRFDESHTFSTEDPNTVEPDWAVVSFGPEVQMIPSSTEIVPTGVGFAAIGDPVCTTGITSGFACGTVIELEGDYIITDFPRDHGDSGGPLIRSTDGAALGVASFTNGRQTAYYSVPAALFAGNLTLNTDFGPRR